MSTNALLGVWFVFFRRLTDYVTSGLVPVLADSLAMEYLIFHWCGLHRQGVVAGRSSDGVVPRLRDSLLLATSQLIWCHSSTPFNFIKPRRFRLRVHTELLTRLRMSYSVTTTVAHIFNKTTSPRDISPWRTVWNFTTSYFFSSGYGTFWSIM